MDNWKDDKTWSDRFLPEIKRILGENLIKDASIEEDAERNTDLIVLSLSSVRIACRVRRYCYLKDYSNEFTIRVSRPSGNKTEIVKIMEGWGDYFFYGFSDEQEKNLELWRLCSLDVFREWVNQYIIDYHKKPGILKSNNDESSRFRVFNVKKLPKNFVVATNVLFGEL